MELLTKKEAIGKGLKTYFNGKSCKRGHLSERYSTSGHCITCILEYSKTYYGDNKEYIFIKQEKNKEYKSIYQVGYYEKNKEYLTVYKAGYYQSHKSESRIRKAIRRSAKLQRTPTWGNTWLQRLLKEEIYLVAEIKSITTGILQHVDHYYPLQGELVSGLHVAANLKVIPEEENLRKHNKMPEDFYGENFVSKS